MDQHLAYSRFNAKSEVTRSADIPVGPSVPTVAISPKIGLRFSLSLGVRGKGAHSNLARGISPAAHVLPTASRLTHHASRRLGRLPDWTCAGTLALLAR